MNKKGIIFIISAPSGAGKTTLCKDLMLEFPDIKFSISCTTRKMRPGEVDGKDYHFISKDQFKKIADEGDFAEWAEVHGELYGTTVKELKKAAKEGFDLILDIDWQGARQIKEKINDCVYIFIHPPSLEELENRLRKRGKDSDETIKKRLKNAKEEMSHSGWYDHNITNDKLTEAMARLKSIVKAERYRKSL
ncbi:MAG: guanylate kinase [bacterium]|nr:guanylate kinase [bacterium]